MKRMLCVFSQPPMRGSTNIELLESALVGAVFDLEVSVLLRGNGVWALQPLQDASTLGSRTLTRMLEALPTYDVQRLFVCKASLRQLGLSVDLGAPAWQSIDLAEQARLIADQDVVVGASA